MPWSAVSPPNIVLRVKGTVMSRVGMTSAPRKAHGLVGGARQLHNAY